MFDVRRAFATWTIGVGFAGIAFLVFPFFFRGTFHHNAWLMWCLFVRLLVSFLGVFMFSLINFRSVLTSIALMGISLTRRRLLRHLCIYR